MEEAIWLNDMLMHAGAGFAVSWMDYLTHKALNKKEDRLANQRQCIASIETILSADPRVKVEGVVPMAERDSIQYHQNVEYVKGYLADNGISVGQTYMQRAKNFVKGLLKRETLNNAGWQGKAIFTVAAELGYDSVWGLHYYTQVLKESPIAAIARNIYQMPAFFIGLYVGQGATWLANQAITSREERKHKRMIREYITNTPLLDTLENYEPSQNIKAVLKSQGTLGQIKSGVSSGAKLITGGLRDFQARREEQEAQERAARKSRFDELTKNH